MACHAPNPKSESRNPKQNRNSNFPNTHSIRTRLEFSSWDLEFASDFEIRISDLAAAAHLFHDTDVLAREVANALEVAFGDRFRLDELAADAERTGAGAEELGRGLQVDGAARHQADVRQRAAQGLGKRRPYHFRREHFDDISARFPAAQYFRRREGAGQDELAIPLAQPNDIAVDR